MLEIQAIFPLRNTSSPSSDLTAYVPALRRFLAKRAGTADVDDLVQDVLLRMHIRGQEDVIANVEGYLFQVASSVLMDRARRDKVRHRSAHFELTEMVHPVEERTPERVVRGREAMARLFTALADMPECTRNAFILHRFEDMSYPDIADHLGMSTSAVGRHIMKAVRFLVERDLP